LENLVEAVAPVSANGKLYLIVPPKRQTSVLLQTFRQPFEVLTSGVLPADTAIMVAANGLSSATDEAPKISVAREATINLSDTPLPIVDGSGTTASPTRDLRQTDTLAVGLTFMADWARRHDQAVAYMTGISW
jgi:hypothetical protein